MASDSHGVVTVTPWELASLYEQTGGVRERVWKLLAYLGRYGHQSMRELRDYPVRELNRLAEEVSALVGIENESAQSSSGG